MKFLSKILANAGLITNYADFDTASTQVGAVGRMVWNNTDGTVDLGLKGGNVTLQVGQEIVARVVNKSGADLLEANYQVVKVSDAQGQRLAVDLAQADSDANSADTLGIVTETIINNQEGFITILGNVNEINTTGSLQGETWVDGDILYLSPTIAGEITNVKPAAPAHLVVVGYVIYAHAIHGKIYTKIQNGYELNELHDVLITTPLNNQVLGYDSATSLWKNASIATWLGYTPYNAASVSGTSGTIPLFGASNTLGNSIITQSGGNRIDLDSSGSTVLRIASTNNTLFRGLVLAVGGDATEYASFKYHTNSGELRIMGSPTGFGGFTTIYNNNLEALKITTTNQIITAAASAATGEHFIIGGSARVNGTTQITGNTAIGGGFVSYTGFSVLTLANATNGGLLAIRNASDFGLNIFATNNGGVISAIDGTKSLIFQTADIDRLTIANTGAATFSSSVAAASFNVGTGTFSFSSGDALLDYSSASVRLRTFKVGTGYITPLLIDSQTGAATFSSSVTATSLIKSGGTSSQYLMADGSTSTLTNPITGTGTTNYLPKFTASSTIGNSLLFDDGTSVGIGTTSPSKKLDLQGTMNMNGASGTYLQIQYAGANRGYLGTANEIIPSGSTADFGIAAISNLLFGSGGSLTERMRITSGGNVLIGTTTDAGYKLDVNGTARVSGKLAIGSTTNYSALQNANNSGSIYWGIDNSSGSDFTGVAYARFIYSEGAYPLITYVNGSERMRITSGGNLLIGTVTDAGYKLDVNGTARVSGTLTADAALSNTAGAFALAMKGNNTGLRTGIDGSFNIDVYKSGTGYINPLKIDATGAATFSSTLQSGHITSTAGLTIAASNNLTWGGLYGAGIPTITGSAGSGFNFYPTGSTGGALFVMSPTGTFNTNAGTIFAKASGTESSGYQLNAITMGYDSVNALGWITVGGGAARTELYLNKGGGAVYTGSNLSIGGNFQLPDGYDISWGGTYGGGYPTIAGADGTGLNFYPDGVTSGATLALASSGAATFSSSITTTQGTVHYGGTNTYVFGDNTDLYLGTAGSARLTITSTGAATFSSTVSVQDLLSTTVGNGISAGGTSFTITPSATRGVININGSTDQFLTFSTQSYIYNGTTFRMLSTSDIDFVAGGVQRLLISASTGAATFYSNLNVVGDITLTTAGNVLRSSDGSALVSKQSTNEIWIGGGGVSDIISLRAGGSESLRILANQAATFSSSVTASSLSLTTGNLNLGTSSNAGVVNMYNASTVPSASITNGVILYAQDVDPGTGASSELKVRDEAGNITTLSPHNFSLIPNGPSEELAWSYYSEKKGKKINVDMLKLARLVESLTDEQLVYIQ